MPSIAQLIVWIIIGLLGGSLSGLLVKRERRGFGVARNLGIGLIGAVIGGLLFRLFGLFPGLDKVTISLRDVISLHWVAACARCLMAVAALEGIVLSLAPNCARRVSRRRRTRTRRVNPIVPVTRIGGEA